MKKRISLNKGWSFSLSDYPAANAAKRKTVDIPHTWNNIDGQDGGGDYYRGCGCYVKTVEIDKKEGAEYYLEFYGVNSVCNVYVNGGHIGSHRGGYTLFRFNITREVKSGKNEIAVTADNSPFPDIIPLTADFTFFGGIYRDVNLIEVSGAHFSLDDFGSDGVYISYPNNSDIVQCANTTVKAKICGDYSSCVMKTEIYEQNEFTPCLNISQTDFDRNEIVSERSVPVAEVCSQISGGAAQTVIPVRNPKLWEGRRAPHRYKVVCTIIQDSQETDRVEKYIGYRYFSIDSKKGFFLNGRSYPLRGVNRHQDRENMGWAITRREHEEDFALIYEIGANAVRLAHYPHHPHFYEQCDKYGILVWAEIPFVDNIGGMGLSPLETDKTQSRSVTISQLDNARLQLKELILQQYHRPSVFCWSMSNEVRAEYDSTAGYMMSELNALAHSLDPRRYTALATNNYTGEKWKSDIKGCNIYPGWYWGSKRMFHSQSAAHVRANGGRGVAVSEYGAGANINHHSENPKQPRDTTCEFHCEEWQSVVHEHALKYFMSPKADKIWGTFVWNMFDFAVDSRDEGGIPGRNDKGLVTYDRKVKKDAFFLYKAYWSRERVVHITSRRFERRQKRYICVKVYSNEKTISLYVNGRKAGEKQAKSAPNNHIFMFRGIKLKNGVNEVKAVSENGISDCVVWKY